MECFTCEIVAGTIEERVHENMAWLDVAHLWDVDWLPADVEVVRQLEERLAGEGRARAFKDCAQVKNS